MPKNVQKNIYGVVNSAAETEYWKKETSVLKTFLEVSPRSWKDIEKWAKERAKESSKKYDETHLKNCLAWLSYSEISQWSNGLWGINNLPPSTGGSYTVMPAKLPNTPPKNKRWR